MRRADKEFQKWVASRPPLIREAIYRWPIGTTVMHNGSRLYLLGWNETEGMKSVDDVVLIFSHVNPFVDFDAAKADKIYVHAHHLSRSVS